MALRRAESKAKRKQVANEQAAGPSLSKSGFAAYLRQSKNFKNSVVLVLPLFVAYQVGILFSGGVRNGSDFVTDAFLLVIRSLLRLPKGNLAEPAQGNVLLVYLAANLLLGLLLLAMVWRFRRQGRFSSKLFPLLVFESGVYALFFSTIVALMMSALGLEGLLRASFETYAPMFDSMIDSIVLAAPNPTGVRALPLLDRIVMSIGAGLYEELVFRLLLMGGLFQVFTRTLSLPKLGAAVLAVLLSSLVFSLVHHTGNMGEVFSVGAFSYRFFAGLLLACIFYIRGFAVAVYTHALYDILVLVLRT